jgi:secreted PhoX family phosphatase
MLKKILLVAALAAILSVPSAQAGELEFTTCPFPSTDLEKRVILTSQYASVDGEIVDIGYRTIFRSGDKGILDRHSDVFGQLVDEFGDDLLADDGSKYISNDNDFSALVNGADDRLYMVSHFESRPAAMYLTQLRQDKNGYLIPLKTRPLDFSEVNGGWVHCAGSVTPWGNHLGSEEYEPNAATWVTGDPNDISDYDAAMAAYLGIDPDDRAAVQAGMNPYDYGYVVETTVTDYDTASVEKHYAMGRVAIELAYVMPDEQTVYISDDGTNVGLFRYEAATPGDLSAGTLYAAKYNETDTAGMGAADLTWVELGTASGTEIRTIIDTGGAEGGPITYNDIFETATPASPGVCPAGFTSINCGHSGANHQCLKVKPGQDKAAAFLETRRYAAMMGATTEWRKMEGITFNPDTDQLYIAMSSIEKGMENDTGSDVGGPNHIKVATKNKCGGVYVLDVDANYDAVNIYGLVAGTPVAGEEDPPDSGIFINQCDIDGLANPDNITYITGYNTLIIGEDTGNSGHQNDVIWSYNLTDKKLTRIQTTPYGSETTSPYFYPDINGFAYIMSVVQHPYGESDEDKIQDPSDARGYTGYMGPFPAMNP